MIRVALFVAGSLFILWVSRRSLRHPDSHGFGRFFAFEAILALVLLNVLRWFADPLGWLQLASWTLLVLSVVLVVWGVVLLHRAGGSAPVDDASPSYDWERTARLVTSGIYGYIRHPMYASLLLLTWGALLKWVTVPGLALAGLATVALAVTARAEEAENLARFGEEYREYMGHTRRFVPFVY